MESIRKLWNIACHVVDLIVNGLTVLFIRSSGVKMGKRVRVGTDCEVALGRWAHRQGKVVLSDRCTIATGALLHPCRGHIHLGNDVYVGPYSIIYGNGGVDIGSDTLIGPHCKIVAANHTIAEIGSLIRLEPEVSKPVKIGRDVWLGAGVTVLAGVTLEDGCVVGAGAVVTKSLPANSIALGVPAQVVGYRPEWDVKKHPTLLAGSPGFDRAEL